MQQEPPWPGGGGLQAGKQGWGTGLGRRATNDLGRSCRLASRLTPGQRGKMQGSPMERVCMTYRKSVCNLAE
jgi:hypothetical protein